MRPFRSYPAILFLLTPLREGRRSVEWPGRSCWVYFYSRPCGRGDLPLLQASPECFPFLLTPLREGRLLPCAVQAEGQVYFYSRPCGRGDVLPICQRHNLCRISTHAPAGGATIRWNGRADYVGRISTHAPAGGATPRRTARDLPPDAISTHAPAGGATPPPAPLSRPQPPFLLTPLREGRRVSTWAMGKWSMHFYSRPCGRGDLPICQRHNLCRISTHAPAGGATAEDRVAGWASAHFYSRPCGRGDRSDAVLPCGEFELHFYSRPCGRGDHRRPPPLRPLMGISTHAPAGGATHSAIEAMTSTSISTHAPAGGATAIFHKSVMRFCGKLPKDDTVLCLASFGFPRRDPKAVYLAWISCANLPQKCVRQGLALKDQGTSCFHEGLASHAFDPVLV